ASDPLLGILCATTLLAPLVGFGCLGIGLLLRRAGSESAVATIASTALVIALASAMAAGIGMVAQGVDQVFVDFGRWFTVGAYGFELTLLVDGLSLPFVLLTCVLTGLVGHFSVSYMH